MKHLPAHFVGEPSRKFFVPRSVIKTIRDEITDLPLMVRQYVKNSNGDWELIAQDTNELPAGLQGYIFTVGALFQAQDRPQEDGTQLYTGDGMIYRLGFERGQAILKTRIAKTPCYYADLATAGDSNRAVWQPQTEFAKKHRIFSFFAAFRNGGPSRFSILLGGRNQLNTAFLKVGDRLIVTIDAGRPYEVDPNSLELLAPIGKASCWLGIFPIVSRLVAKFAGSYPFDVYINAAHPVADTKKANNIYGSTINGFLTTNYSTGYNGLYRKPVNWFFDKINHIFRGEATAKEQFGRFTDLIYYTFDPETEFSEPELKRWRLVLANGQQKGKPVIVEQSLHQLAITEDFIILADIAFKMEFSQIFSPFFFGFLKLKLFQKFWSLGAWIYGNFLRAMPPLPNGIIYIVKRSDLEKYPACTADTEPTTLPALQVILPHEISHFAADYNNPDGKITLHVGHINGWDVTEWITRYDLSVANKQNLRCDLEGMQVSTTDLGCLAKYAIDGNTGEIENIQTIRDTEFTWSPSIYTHSELSRDDANNQEEQIKNLYWLCWGFSWELIPQRIYDAYKSRESRTIPIEDLPSEDKPLTLVRLDTDTMTVADSFQFPRGYFVSSPQFVPSSEPLPEAADPSTHGYIVCVVLADNLDNEEESCDEFWVFHADDFQNKPIYRLLAPSGCKPLNLALTLHTTWMREIGNYNQTARYGEQDIRQQIRKESVCLDYKSRLKRANSAVHELFDDIVYGYFTEQLSEKEAISRLQQSDYKIRCDCSIDCE
jgi:hypothetical protein